MTTKELQLNQATLTMAHNAYRKGLSTYAFYKVSNHEKSDDLVQETFLKTWRYIVKGGKIELMKAFLYHVLSDLIVDDYRKHKTISLDVLPKEHFEPSFDNRECITDDFDGGIAISLIDSLPRKYQQIMHMKYVEDLSIDEMSTITKQSKNTVAVQVHRGLEKLKCLFGNYKNKS